jgi:DNA-binding NtrC family response regulator
MTHAITSTEVKTEPGVQYGSGTMQVAARVTRTPPSNAPLSLYKPIVLIVDDDEQLRASLVRMLDECDLAAVGATSSINALEVLQHSPVDIVVSDQFTWGMDGVSLLSTVRRRWPRVQRILFTSDASPDIMLDAINRAGVHKVLLKTMHAVQIRDEIESVALDVLRRR